MNGGFMSSLFKKKADEEESCGMKFGLARIFKYQELKKATNSFATELGHGGYGRVYLGKLGDGQMVAVKVLFDRNPKRLEQFFNEVNVLSRVRHKNLITLYGCTNPTGQELLLVYEYASNGTVADHLHGQQSALNWAARIRIAVETAEALAYLHGMEPPIIHRDVKTSNILLDHTFRAKVADLGICRLLPWDTDHVSTLPQGTMGYRDPEYDRCFRLTDKTDVYSFGVVLMEFISGQQAVDVTRENIYLDGMAISKIMNDKLEEFVDPKLGYHANNDIRGMINSVAQLAVECLQPFGNLRPSMVQIVTVLKGFQNEKEQVELNELVSLSSNPQKELRKGRLDHLNDVDFGLSVDMNSASEKTPGTPIRVPPSPARVRSSPSQSCISQLSRVGSVHLSVSQIYKATKNFSPSLRLGKGGFGTVYKAVLPDGQVVAVKRAKKEHIFTLQDEFSNEVELLFKIEHRNLVMLLGYTEKGNERIIITEHVPNGTLREHLDGQHGKILDFNQRLEIAIDVAHALTYLHLYAEKTIIHQDVKSSNILLTENYRAKVSDSGFAKGATNTEQTHIMTKVKGTAGYLDSEYFQTYRLTPKSDVFSFGMLLIEILSGRRPVELKRAIKEMITLRWAFKNYNEGNLRGILDPSLNEPVDKEVLSRMINLAFQCAAPTHAYRPVMKEVGEQLWEIRKDYGRARGR